MPVYRHYVRLTEDGFDGATPEAATYTQTGLVWRATALTPVGIWDPLKLGRVNVISLVRVATSDTDPGDLIQVLDTFGSVRMSFATSLAGTPSFLMLPDDRLKILSGGRRVDITVDDLDDPQLIEFFSAQTIANGAANGGSLGPYSETLMTDGGPTEPWVGRRQIFLNLAISNAITLPELGDIALGDEVTYTRIGGVGEARIMAEDAGDQVNGLTGITETQWSLSTIGASVTYRRVSGGWEHRQGPGAPTTFITSAASFTTESHFEGTRYVRHTAGSNGASYDLNPIATYKAGARIVVENQSAFFHLVTPDGAELINGQNVPILINPNGVAVIESDGTQWAATTYGNPEATSGAGTPLVIPAWSGVKVISMTGAAAQTALLPLTSDVPIGAIAFVNNATANAHVIDGNGANINGAATKASAANEKHVLVNGGALGWFAVTSL